MERAGTLSERPYEAFGGERVAPLSAGEQQAVGLAGTFGSRVAPFSQRLQAGFSPESLSQFENPYLERVLSARRRGIGEEFGRQAASLEANRSAMDAFRSGRTDLARSRLNESRLRALDEAEGETRAQAYQSALDAYFRQQAGDISAMGATGDILGREIGALSATGATERSVRQASADFDYGQFLERRDWDVNNLGILLNAISAANPTAASTDVSKTKQSGWGQAIGAIATVAGAYLTGGASLAVQGAVSAGGGNAMGGIA